MSDDYLLEMKNKFYDINFNLYGKEAFDYYDLDIEFHKYIISSSRNYMLIDFMNKIYDHDYRIRVKSILSKEDIEGRLKPEHFKIIDSIIEKTVMKFI